MFMNGVNLLFRLSNVRIFLIRNRNVGNRNGNGSLRRIFVAHRLNIIKHLCRNRETVLFDTKVDNLTELLLAAGHINLQIKQLGRIASINKTEVLRNVLIEDKTSESSIDNTGMNFTVYFTADSDSYRSVKSENAIGISHHRLVEITENMSLAGLSRLINSKIVGTKHHILRRNGDGFTVHRLKKVICRKHKEACLSLCLRRKRNVNRHLVAVKIGIECGTDKRMELDGASLNKNRFKCLNRKTVKGRRTVEKDRMLFDHIFKSVPYAGVNLIDLLLCIFNIGSLLRFHKTLHNKGFKEFESHFLRQTTLIYFQFRSDDNNRTSRIIDSFTEKILTETPLLTSEHLRERFQRTV